MPFVALLCYARAARPSRPTLYEAARVDGAGRARHVPRRSRCRCCGRVLLIAAALPHARCAARLRPDVRPHRRRPRGHDGDADRLRVPRACSRRCSSASARPSGVVVFVLVMLVAWRLSAAARRAGGRRVRRAVPASSRRRPCSRCWRSTPCRSSGRSSPRSSPRPSCCAAAAPAEPADARALSRGARAERDAARARSTASAWPLLTTAARCALGVPAAYALARLPVPGQAPAAARHRRGHAPFRRSPP